MYPEYIAISPIPGHSLAMLSLDNFLIVLKHEVLHDEVNEQDGNFIE